ncbi:MAG: DNA-directed RNA polymerase subunit alpha [Candidatus Omnitrophota bacterium]|jgi:DNA-directed RNA polymerase subunit alpha|nr:MAG: DNA-directed RNA polymerase subunit alpha [Candidatus Omnitrophota bacterium]
MKFKPVVMPGRIHIDPESLTERYGKFVLEPLERGFGTTLGNSLRRVLLSSIQGAAVKAIRITGVLQEVSFVPGVVEDVTDIILNIKGLRVKNHRNGPVTLFLQAKGEGEVKADRIEPNPDVEIMNPELHIATLDKDGELEMELYVDVGRGYLSAERQVKQHESYPLNTILVDAIFTPIERVKYSVENARVGDITDYDRLIMEIWTDGTITPRDAIAFSAKILKDHLLLFIHFPQEDETPAEGMVEQTEVVNPYLSKGVEELELSVRSYNCLKAANIKSVGELVTKTESEMLKYRNFGKKSLTEIREVLTKYNLTLGMSLSELKGSGGTTVSEHRIPALMQDEEDFEDLGNEEE